LRNWRRKFRHRTGLWTSSAARIWTAWSTIRSSRLRAGAHWLLRFERCGI